MTWCHTKLQNMKSQYFLKHFTRIKTNYIVSFCLKVHAFDELPTAMQVFAEGKHKGKMVIRVK